MRARAQQIFNEAPKWLNVLNKTVAAIPDITNEVNEIDWHICPCAT